MSVELSADGVDVPPCGRPNLFGDLATVLEVAPMFRRTVVGYDRYQVDSYVRWAEDELATAGREREHLEVRHLRTRAALDEAERLLAHSPSGGEFLQLSRRLGSLLATAADEAESMRADAEADRAAAAAEAERRLDHAEQLLAVARAEAAQIAATARAAAERSAAEARLAAERAGRTLAAADAEAAARLEAAQVAARRAAEQAAHLRQDALAEVSAARLRARHEIVAMLAAGREERRRADATADATRRRLDDEATARRSALGEEVRTLERRRSTLRVEVDLLAQTVPGRTRRRSGVRMPQLLDPLRWRSRSLGAP